MTSCSAAMRLGGVIVEQPLHRPLVGGESLDVEPVVLGAQRKEASVVEVCHGADDRGLVFERATVAY